METVVAIIAIIAGIIGILGSILPALPGPPLTWVGLTLLLVMLGVTILVSVIDYVVPMYLTKVTGGSKYASRGALIGLILGTFFIPPFGMIIGSFLGAFLLELYFARKSSTDALKSAAGSFLGFIVGTGLKIIACCVMIVYIFIYSF